MTYKIVVAADSFKGSATSLEIGQAVKKGIHSLYPQDEVTVFSIADGGEGTVASIMTVVPGTWKTVSVQDPLGRDMEARYGLVADGKTAVIEVAEASGLTLVAPEDLDVMKASSFGTGELIVDAIEKGVDKIYVGLGGSATNDGGLGMLSALGVRFLDADGKVLDALPKHLHLIEQLDLSCVNPRLSEVAFVLLSDVSNPLCGDQGATAVYGPQKGATKEQIPCLDAALSHFADVCEKTFNTTKRDLAGAGAAGGLGFAFLTFCSAQIEPGIDALLELIQIEESISNSSLVITGEGRMDSQSLNGKAPIGIARIAKKYQVPTIAIVGSVSGDLTPVYQAGISGVFDIVNQPMPLSQAMTDACDLVTDTVKNIIVLYHCIMDKRKET